MKTFQLEGSPRADLGKKATKALRREDLIPVVLYGSSPFDLPYAGTLSTGDKVVETKYNKGLIVTDFVVSKESVRKLIYTPEIFIIDLDIKGNKKVKAILKDIQFHPVTDEILHIDFLEIFEDKPILMDVPVALVGHSEGVKAGGKLSLEMRKLKVKALYPVIPEKLTINIDSLGLGKTIQVGALSFENLELVNSKNAVVCAVKLTRAARGAAAAAAAANK
jgi:ribosomal protein L25, Ctc-form